MQLGQHSLSIPQGIERDGGYVAMSHGTQYTANLTNHSQRYCEAEVKVDGLVIGTFRLSPGQTMGLERSPADNGRFTFLRSGSSEAAAAGEASVEKGDKGLIQVTFTPGDVHTPPVLRAFSGRLPCGLESMTRGGGATRGGSFGAGMTGLTGHSSQTFTSVQPLVNKGEPVTISLRLVEDKSAPAVRPLPGRVPTANPVPEPVEG